eukprot:4402769-Amphidinium_carterae.1
MTENKQQLAANHALSVGWSNGAPDYCSKKPRIGKLCDSKFVDSVFARFPEGTKVITMQDLHFARCYLSTWVAKAAASERAAHALHDAVEHPRPSPSFRPST